MNVRVSIAWLVTALSLAAAGGGVALAQQTTGRIVGRVAAERTGAPLSGVTVVAHGPQGDEATLSDERGEYTLDALPVGTYVVRFYVGGSTATAERRDVVVSAEKTVRANVQLAERTDLVETIVIRERPPVVDVGSPRAGLVLDEATLRNLPIGRTFGEALTLAPRTFTDPSGNASVAGASGLENIYVVDGLNTTGLEYGDIMNRRADASGGSNLPVEFVKELSIDTGGYAAEHGGAMGGVVNVVTKSGTNEWHGSVFSLWAPSFLAGEPKEISTGGSVLSGRERPVGELTLGFELGGPILRDRLFFWAGFAPQLEWNTFERQVQALTDADGDGVADLDEAGNPRLASVGSNSTKQRRRSFAYGAKITYAPAADHRLNLSLFGTPTRTRHVGDRSPYGGPELADPRWAEQRIRKTNTDLVAQWTSHFFDRRFRVDATAGLHHERYDERSPYADLNARNMVEWHGARLFDLEGTPGCEPRGDFDPCPVGVYRTGGYGLLKSYVGERWTGDLRSTHFLDLLGRHELKYGLRLELNRLDQTRRFSGEDGSRGFVTQDPGNAMVMTLFSLPEGRFPYQFADGAPGNLDPNGDGSPAELAGPGFYQDALRARVKNLTTAYFIQDSFSPLPHLTLNLGARLESQRLYDSRGERIAKLSGLGFRGGFVFDPTREGRARLYGHYGRFYEAVPLNLLVRYFGGEGLLLRNYDPATCSTPPSTWQETSGAWAGCSLQPEGAYGFFNNGKNYPVQPHLRAQHHDELIAGAQHEVREGLVLGVEATHRWLGAVIEDGTTADDTFVLANPGRVPGKAIGATMREIAEKQAVVAATTGAERARHQAELGELRTKLTNLQGLAKLPKPERTYSALTLSASQRISRRLFVQGSYTLSRLVGNYNGLYDADNDYLAPNGNNAFDTPDLVLNKRGRLANDRPHSGRVSGFYEQPIGRGSLLFGTFFSVFSGVPRNHQAALFPGQQLVFLLPRGSAGRTPTVTQLDLKLSYRAPVSRLMSVELFFDLFNVLNSRTPLRLDDDYTYDSAAAIVNGSRADLANAKAVDGRPVAPNPNFGRATAYQAPIHGRLGARLWF